MTDPATLESMAREAFGIPDGTAADAAWWAAHAAALTRFAELVRADALEQAAIVAVEVAAAHVKKHEAMAEDAVKQPYANNRLMHVGWGAAEAIRAMPPSP